MAPKFGTSGLRGLVIELTPDLVAAHVRAFVAACPTGGTVFLGQDLRASSPEIAESSAQALMACGQRVIDCGVLPTPALALAAMAEGAAALMITGSHIPADRNGLKFYLPTGEITKADEAAILGALGKAAPQGAGGRAARTGLTEAYVARYAKAYGPAALAGLRIGVYQHSSAAREAMMAVVAALGGEPVAIERSETFIPVDTEAIAPETRDLLARVAREQALDALISTDGDADRPLVTDAAGQVVPGDVLGVLTARSLGARVICTPVSTNSMVNAIPEFTDLRLTRIGSPFVIAAMEAALARDPQARVAGFEPNGGFLLGFEAQGPAGPLPRLMTRDAFLPILAPLVAARAAGIGLAALVAALPPRFTATDRLPEVPTEATAALVARLGSDAGARDAFLSACGGALAAGDGAIERTDGLRMTLASGQVLHLRPSGNAPELRLYTEAESPAAAQALLARGLGVLRGMLG